MIIFDEKPENAMVNIKQALNNNIIEIKLDEADRLAETDNTRLIHSEIFDKVKIILDK